MYSARKSGNLVQLEDARNQTVVSIVQPIGNTAIEMNVKGQNLLRQPGIPFLAPWANRLDEQAFYANGKRYAFDMDLGNVSGESPIHGYLTTTDLWQLVELRADSESAWATSRLDFFREPMWMRQFPFAHTIEMTHRLREGLLEVQTRMTNMSVEPMPVSVGFHPYLRLTDSAREEWTISVPARTRWILAATKAPNGETEPAERLFPGSRPASLKDHDLDDVFSDLVRDPQGRAHFILKGHRQQVDVIFGSNWRAAAVWTPNPSDFICIEPMAAISNGMNLAQKGLYKDLQYIQAGATWQESFWIQPRGF
jgi:aldose 1-epimerase